MKQEDEALKVIKEIEAEILLKLDKIKENVITKSYSNRLEQIQILAMVNDELSDVVLNWDPRYIDQGLGENLY